MVKIRTVPRRGVHHVDHVRLVTYARNGHDVDHYVPEDVIEHKTHGLSCVCGPDVAATGVGWVVVHHGLQQAD